MALVSSELATETICAATGRWAAIVSMLASTFSMSKTARATGGHGSELRPGKGVDGHRDGLLLVGGEPGGGVPAGHGLGQAEALQVGRAEAGQLGGLLERSRPPRRRCTG